MPAPTSSLSTLRPDLGGSFFEFELAASRMGFIGHQVLRPFTTIKQSGPFGKIPLEQLLQKAETKRAPGSRYNRGDWKFETDSFATEEHGWEEPVDDREAEMYSDYFDAEQVSAARARDRILRNAEQRIADIIFDNSNFTNATAGTAWTTHATADPQGDVETRVQAIRDASGLMPNTIIIPWVAFRNLRQTTQFKDAVSSSGAGSSELPGRIVRQQVAEFFDIPNVLIPDAQKNTANLGQNATLAEVWDKTKVWIGRVAMTNDIQEPSVGRTFVWQADGGLLEGTAESYRDENVRSDIIRVRHDVDEKLIHTAAGQILTGVTA